MNREWKPGDVAMLKCRDGSERIAILTDRGDLSPLWIAEAVEWGRLSDDVPVRPLVVIDPEDREQVERLVRALADVKFWSVIPVDVKWIAHRSGQMEDALREFANPTPPKPDEPTGLGAVVEDADGVLWVRAGKELQTPDHWRATSGENLVGWWATWERITAVRVLSEGVRND